MPPNFWTTIFNEEHLCYELINKNSDSGNVRALPAVFFAKGRFKGRPFLNRFLPGRKGNGIRVHKIYQEMEPSPIPDSGITFLSLYLITNIAKRSA
ncbi:hypothetical protein P421_03325 [Heyndrickxia coagulans P38]|nr:hypothetical protein P421_03325 [Heyndrickxia coagulans P38]